MFIEVNQMMTVEVFECLGDASYKNVYIFSGLCYNLL